MSCYPCPLPDTPVVIVLSLVSQMRSLVSDNVMSNTTAGDRTMQRVILRLAIGLCDRKN